MISVYFAGPMTGSPFERGRDQASAVSTATLSTVDSPDQADIIVGMRVAALSPLFSLRKRYFIWVHEPFLLQASGKFIIDQATDTRIGVSTAFNGDIYLSPFTYFPFKTLNIDDVITLSRKKDKGCVMLATFRAKSDRYVENRNVDLTDFRQRLARKLHAQGKCDIHGRGWPADVKTEGDSRGAGWHTTKLNVLEDYKYNIAMENTITENYVTEKHWDATISGCVQLYFATGSGIEKFSSSNSLLDCASDDNGAWAFDRLESIKQSEREDMLRRAVASFNDINDNYSRQNINEAILSRFCLRIEEELDEDVYS